MPPVVGMGTVGSDGEAEAARPATPELSGPRGSASEPGGKIVGVVMAHLLRWAALHGSGGAASRCHFQTTTTRGPAPEEKVPEAAARDGSVQGGVGLTRAVAGEGDHEA
ncbi:hypothetical protein GCM10009826_31270 [Humibacillus xanthopallidus]